MYSEAILRDGEGVFQDELIKTHLNFIVFIKEEPWFPPCFLTFFPPSCSSNLIAGNVDGLAGRQRAVALFFRMVVGDSVLSNHC
ncbi:hypothetical protein BG621_01090 [Parasaccharibacter apium]|nr:hypothetical protein BG621_01090 [Parasaccharibacter apium]